jgi:hypothetical protein
MPAEHAQDEAVNPHFLDHVVATGATHDVQASEDIVARNGTKLLTKGARVNAALRDRLLDHKLRKPLEQCLEVVDGVVAERFGPIAERLLDSHGLLGLSRQTLVLRSVGELSGWRARLFVAMSRNASIVADYFALPANAVVELGTRVQV